MILNLHWLVSFWKSKNTFEKNTFNVDKPNKSVFGLEVYQKNNRRFAEV